MPRPIKRGVDYFPHDAHASDGETVSILENHFGAEGYMAWFKLLERLACAGNHVIDVRNPENLEFLAAKLKLSPKLLDLILNKIATLKAIDPELWSVRIIWCQNLVDNLAAVYHRRNQEIPQKPVVSSYNNPVSSDNNPVSDVDNPTRESRESRESREIYSPLQDIIDLWKELVPSLPKPESPVDSSSSRAKSIKARWKQNPDPEAFRSLFTKVQASDFLSGRSGKWTACNIDWVLKPSNWQKIKEGNYDNKGGSNGISRQYPQSNRPSGAFEDIPE